MMPAMKMFMCSPPIGSYSLNRLRKFSGRASRGYSATGPRPCTNSSTKFVPDSAHSYFSPEAAN